MPSFTYLTWGELTDQLLERLQDAGGNFTSRTEAQLYMGEGLRLLNAITLQWNTDYQFDFNAGDTWKTVNIDSSPRQRTVTDTEIYTQMEYMLMEPATGGVWSGTTMYSIDQLAAAAQYRRDELLLECAADVVNLVGLGSPLYPGVSTVLPDSSLNLLRVRWLMADSTNDLPYVLGREDVTSTNAFGPQTLIQPGDPESWLVTSTEPLVFDVNRPPNQPGNWDLLVSFAGLVFSPPTATLVGIPDDWTPAILYGALADVLANSPEGRDSSRAKYCMERYEQLKRAMRSIPWLLDATIASISTDTPSYKEIDSWLQNWESRQNSGDPQIVVGGIDFIALAPFIQPGGATVSSILTVVENAPLPATEADFVELARDGVDALLAYAQHVASFKMGGRDFMATMPLYQQFEAYCRKKNAQYAALGIARFEMLLEGNRADEYNPRFEKTMEEAGTRGKATR